MKSIFFILISVTNFNVFSQIQDTPWKKNISEREFIPYQEVREADVFWSKRLWQIIDTREKQNLIFINPQLSLIEILHTAAMNGEIKAYDNSVINGDQFKIELNKEQISSIGRSRDTIYDEFLAESLLVESNETNSNVNSNNTLCHACVVIENEFDFSSVKRFKIKEDWFFNSATSTMEVRIVGIAPLMEVYDDYGNYLGDETLYWLYYPELRPILAKYEAYNTGNFAQRLSWDDIFVARYFSSYIYKEDNVYDRPIQQYAAGKDVLYESERIKQMIFNFEHDLWSY